jgi:FkbM family methyltransferase
VRPSRPRLCLRTAIIHHALSVASRPPLLLRNVDRITTPTPNQFASKPALIPSKLAKTNTYKQRKSIPTQAVILSGETPKLIKIDVEGFELHVLQGLEKLLMSQHPAVVMVMEMIAGHLANADTKVEDIVSFMTEPGYAPFQIWLKRSGFRHELVISKTSVAEDVNDDVLWIHPDKPS